MFNWCTRPKIDVSFRLLSPEREAFKKSVNTQLYHIKKINVLIIVVTSYYDVNSIIKYTKFHK
jgi:hypothetical protein